MKKRLLSLVLCLVMVFTLFPAFGISAAAVRDPDTGIENPEIVSQNGLNLVKTLTPGADGTYDINLEAWSTGKVEYTTHTEKIPTDFVVVVDQSGSMAEKDMSVGTNYTQVNNVSLYDAASGDYYYKVGDQYYRVYGQRGYMYERHSGGNVSDYVDTSYFEWLSENDNGQEDNPYNLFFDRDANGNYHKVTVSVRYRGLLRYDVHFYSDINDFGTYRVVGAHLFGSFVIGTDPSVNFTMYKRWFGYNSLYYRDVNGNVYTLDPNNLAEGEDTAEFCKTSTVNGERVVRATANAAGTTEVKYDNLYRFDGTKETRLSALETALNEFVAEVAKEKDDNGLVDNRIAIVGFASTTAAGGTNTDNTELLTGTALTTNGATPGSNYPNYSASNGRYWSFPYAGSNYAASTSRNYTNYRGPQYGQSAIESAYVNALLPVVSDGSNPDNPTINADLTKAIKSVTAYGGTQPEYGFYMANSIYQHRDGDDVDGHDKAVEYQYRTGDNKDQWVDRNKIVIFFTDGEPGDNDGYNRYLEANDVVEAAYNLKHYKNPGQTDESPALVFSIGVFGESDSEPLTYVYSNPNGDASWKVEADYHYVRTDSSYGYLFRQWIPGNSEHFGDTPTDTIFDYMSVVSSNYPNAVAFMNEDYVLGTKVGNQYVFNGDYLEATFGPTARNSEYVTTNKYYRMASNQESLIAAFKEAVTLINQESNNSTTVKIDDTAVFKDAVNLEDFDVSGATYTVKWQPVKMVNNALENNGSAVIQVDGAAVDASGVVEATDFNYSNEDYYVTQDSPGYKLVVTITGLTPKKTTGTLYSNADGEELYGAGIYAPDVEEPTVQIKSPSLVLSGAEKTYVIDFNAPMKVATGIEKLGTTTGTNGKFELVDNAAKDVTYQINKHFDLENKSSNIALSGVDTAMVFGAPIGATGSNIWSKITTIPAGSVYFDDDLFDLTTAISVGDGSGYNAGIPTVTSDAAITGAYTFTFNGKGIDIYCTTHTGGGYVQAALFKGTELTANNRVETLAVRNQSNTTRYNIPTVHFDCPGNGEYTVYLRAMEGAQYKIDGVRVYNPVADQSVYTGDAASEKNAVFVNMHDVLVNKENVSYAMSSDMQNAAIGALFVDNSESLTYKKVLVDNNGDPILDANGKEQLVDAYADSFEAYKANSPKNEIYLAKGQEITFQLTDTAKAGKLWIGLSAPDTGKNTSTAVTINTIPVNGEDGITSAVDMYYPITEAMIGTGNSITIKNTGETMISVTDLKITGVESIYNAANPTRAAANAAEPDATVLSVPANVVEMVFEPVTLRTVKLAANNGVDPDAPAVTPEDPEPTQQPTLQEIVRQLLSEFVNNLFSSIGRLFGH